MKAPSVTKAFPTVSAQTLEVTLGEAAGAFLDELDQADATLSADGAEGATEAYLRALGLALQLGPAATEEALRRIL